MTKYNVNGVWYKEEDLQTPEFMGFLQKHNLSASEQVLVPVSREYEKGNEYGNAKSTLINKMVMTGYPHGITTIRGGKPSVMTASRALYRAGHYSGMDNEPLGSSRYLFIEIANYSRNLMSMLMVGDIKLPKIGVSIDPDMFVVDMWEQPVKDMSILFFTAYARFTDMPENWYTRVVFFEDPDTGSVIIYPTTISAFTTLAIDKNSKQGSSLLTVNGLYANLDVFKMVKNGKKVYETVFKYDPIWSLTEREFDLQCPIWWDKFKNNSSEVFYKTNRKGDLSPQYRKVDMTSVSSNQYAEYAITTHWVNPNYADGVAVAYLYNNEKDQLERWYVKTFDDADGRYATPIQFIDKTSVSEYDTNVGHSNTVFRNGFNEKRDVKKYYNKRDENDHKPAYTDKPKTGFNTINIPMINPFQAISSEDGAE